jgi:uncharacterized DUF497 family protein
MIDLSLIVGFDWDAGNIRKSTDKHGVGAREAELVFVDPELLVLVDEEHSGDEKRFHAYGKSAGRLLLVSFTLRYNETMIRVISARNMSRRERHRYAENS